MSQKKHFHNLDFIQLMHPEDKSTIDWLNSLKVPYKTKLEFLKQIALHPTDHNLKEWYEIFKSGIEYYTFRDFLNATTSKYQEAYNEVELQGEGINVTAESLPRMYRQLANACEILGVEDRPAYSTDWIFAPFHYSNGEKKQRIIMASGAIDLMTDEEMLFIHGHELGHLCCGHKPFHMLVNTFYMPFINSGAFKAWATIIKLPLLGWYRKSDYTADRIGLLTCQSIEVALSTMIKKAGLPRSYYSMINIRAFKDQAKRFYEDYSGVKDKVIKELTVRSAEYPWLVDRASKLIAWYESDDYNRVLSRN